MSSKCAIARNKMKEKRSEKYQQQFEKQKKRAAENRRKMKEAMKNPTDEDKQKKKKRLENPSARHKRYLERIKTKTATKSATGSSADGNLVARITKSTVGPSSPQSCYRAQQTFSTAIASGRAPDYNACVEHSEEKVIMWCIDCGRLLCLECLPRHRRHGLTRYRMLEKGETMREVDVALEWRFFCMMMIGSVFYLDTCNSITTYNMNTNKTERIHTDGGCKFGMCVSPDNTSIWYTTNRCKVYEYDVENKTCRLRFPCDSVTIHGICVTRSGHVVLGVWRCSDGSDSSDSDGERYNYYRSYLEMYTQQDSYTKPTTSVCTKGKRGLKYGVKPHFIRECPVTGDLLVAEDIKVGCKTVLLTDDKCNTKYWFRGKTVTNKHGERKRTGYDRRLCTYDAACFDKEGNILIVNHKDHSVIVIDHDTGMYIRTVHQEPDIRRICIQDNGLLWCWVGDPPEYKMKSIKYMEKLE